MNIKFMVNNVGTTEIMLAQFIERIVVWHVINKYSKTDYN